MTPANAVCAVHRQSPAVRTCTRCGLFMCAECQTSDGRCRACVAREPGLPDDGKRAARAKVALIVNAATEGLGILVGVAQLAGAGAAAPAAGEDAPLTPVGMAEACQSLLQLASFIVAIVLFLQWWHLLVRHAHSRGVA